MGSTNGGNKKIEKGDRTWEWGKLEEEGEGGRKWEWRK